MFVLYKQKRHDNFVTMQLFFNNTASREVFMTNVPSAMPLHSGYSTKEERLNFLRSPRHLLFHSFNIIFWQSKVNYKKDTDFAFILVIELERFRSCLY